MDDKPDDDGENKMSKRKLKKLSRYTEFNYIMYQAQIWFGEFFDNNSRLKVKRGILSLQFVLI